MNAEFWGANPNPTSGATAEESVDCRVPTGDPRSTTCAAVLGAGRDSANPAYLLVFPTVFTLGQRRPQGRRRDRQRRRHGGAVDDPRHADQDKPVAFFVKTKSGLTAFASGDNCTVAGGKITALKAEGTCTVRITTTGGKFYRPPVHDPDVRPGIAPHDQAPGPIGPGALVVPGRMSATAQRRGQVATGVAGVHVAPGLEQQGVHLLVRPGQCSTPFGTTNTSSGPSTTSRSRSAIVSLPGQDQEAVPSSVSGWACQTNSPWP
ncbi:MAG: hypothetical protein U0R65_07835 [Candidatus Nanopelagicales bacterium]